MKNLLIALIAALALTTGATLASAAEIAPPQGGKTQAHHRHHAGKHHGKKGKAHGKHGKKAHANKGAGSRTAK